MKYVSRVESRKGWLVRVGYVDGKPIVQKWFYDGRGDKEVSLKNAKVFVENTIKELEKYKMMPVSRYALRRGSNNKSGIVGVYRQREYKKVKGKSVPTDSYRWTGSWYQDGKVKLRNFSEKKYGYKKAKVLAKEARLLQLHKLGVQACPICCARMIRENKYSFFCRNCNNRVRDTSNEREIQSTEG